MSKSCAAARFRYFDGSLSSLRNPRIGDSDDVFYDSARKRIYAIGGEGGVWVYEQQDPDRYAIAAKVATVKGGRTGFFARSRAIVRGRPGERDHSMRRFASLAFRDEGSQALDLLFGQRAAREGLVDKTKLKSGFRDCTCQVFRYLVYLNKVAPENPSLKTEDFPDQKRAP
jgi:hypothetical protein